MCGSNSWSAAVVSRVTRILRYMAEVLGSGRGQTEGAVDRLEHGRGQEGIEVQFHVERDDDRCRGPAEDPDPEWIGERAHLRLFVCLTEQRPDSEAELHAQHNLAPVDKLCGPSLAKATDLDDGV